MSAASIPSDLLCELAQMYERDAAQFLSVPQQQMTSALVREGIAELRNEGYLEEELRGVVRLTARGYKMLQRQLGSRRNVGSEARPGTDMPAWA
jgi:predicted transcriptional regulator